jgi:hypothetical protein
MPMCDRLQNPPPNCFMSLRSQHSPQYFDLNLCHSLVVKDQIPHLYKTNKLSFDLSSDYEEYYLSVYV